MREALEDIASIDEAFVRANGTYAAFDKIIERAKVALSTAPIPMSEETELEEVSETVLPEPPSLPTMKDSRND